VEVGLAVPPASELDDLYSEDLPDVCAGDDRTREERRVEYG
jgi:hypothetical protein